MKSNPFLHLSGSSLTCVLLLFALLVVSSGTADAQGSAQLRVKVLSDNAPVVGATVSLSGSDSTRTGGESQQYTNEAGECAFTQLAGGTYSLSVSKLSFFQISEDGATSSEIVISPGETKVVQSSLTRGGVVTGRLLNSDNEGLTGIPVTALFLDATNPQHNHLPARSESNVISVSDDRGIFRIYGLRPGTYAVAVNAQRDSSLRKDILPLKYLSGADSKSNSGVFIGFAEEIRLPDIQLTANLGQASSMSGTVVGKRNLLLASAAVSLLGLDDQTLSDKVLTNAAGGFSFEGLVPGKYRITVSSKSYRSFMKEVELSPAQNKILEINLLEFPAIEGRTYLLRNERPELLSMLNIALVPLEEGAVINFASGSDGTFSVRTNRTGSFGWNLPGLSKNQYLVSITSGNKDVTSSPLPIGDKSIGDISIYVSTGAASIEGQFPESVQSGCKDLEVYAVLLSSADDNPVIRLKRANTCTGNSFAIYSLPPGKYSLMALPLAKPEETGDRNSSAFPRYQEDIIRAALKRSKPNQSDIITLDRNQIASGRTAIVLPGVRQ